MSRSHLVVEEYTGQLRGGPDDGNFVTSSVPIIKVVAKVELWLDGEDPDKVSNMTVTTGVYRWQSEKHYFNWEPYTASYYRKTTE